jgi:hypothetical protein
VILGCGWTRDAVTVARAEQIDTAAQCPGDYRRLLFGADGDPSEIWPEDTISAVAYGLSASWLLMFLSLAFVLGSFVIWYALQPERKPNRRPPRARRAS